MITTNALPLRHCWNWYIWTCDSVMGEMFFHVGKLKYGKAHFHVCIVAHRHVESGWLPMFSGTQPTFLKVSLCCLCKYVDAIMEKVI